MRSLAPLALVLVAGQVGAAPAERSGKEVVEAVCINCHGTGKDGAPRIDDRAAWAKHAKQGLGPMTQNAITGIRKMPAHGGQASLTDVELSRAVAYMVSGGVARDTGKRYKSPQLREGWAVVQERCATCHTDPKSGAPQMGDMEAWKPRLQAGVDAVVVSAVRGHNAMPARGGLKDLSDADMRAAVVYMLSESARAAKKNVTPAN